MISFKDCLAPHSVNSDQSKMASEEEEDFDEYERLYDAIHQDLKDRKIYVKQSMAKKEAIVWELDGAQATLTDIDNLYPTLMKVVGAIPHKVASAQEIASMLVTMDNSKDRLLSQSSNDKFQKWALGEGHALHGAWSHCRSLWRKCPGKSNS